MSRKATLPTMDDIYRGFLNHQRWAEATLKVRAKSGDLIPYVFAPAQSKYWRTVEKIQAARRPVRIIILKARQVFFSTAVAGHFFQRTAFTPGQHAVVYAHLKSNAKDIYSYYQTFQKHYEPFEDMIIQPSLLKPAGRELAWRNGSWVQVRTAETTEGGRSGSIRFLHLSEYAFYRDPRTLMTGLMQTVPDDPDTCVVIESTANGLGNDFHRIWQRANDPAVDSEWTPLFFAWWEHPEYQRAIADTPEGSARAFQDSLDDEERDLARRFGLHLEQLAWRRWAITNKCEGDDARFRQEYPATPEEAFLASGRPCFDHKSLERQPVIRDEMLVGDLEEERLGTKRQFFFLPKERAALTVYRKPVKGRLYVIGADTAEGIDINDGEGTADPDFSSAQVLEVNSGEQVAKLRARIEPGEFGRYLVSLARWYFDAFLVPESNSVGIATIEQILREGYPPSAIYHRIGSPDDLTDQQSTRLQRVGWKTTSVTRPQLISKLDRALREMSIIIRDAHTLDECRAFVIKPDGRKEHQKGCHDDDVFALALAVVGIEAYPESRRRDSELLTVKKYARSVELPPVEQRRGIKRRMM